MKRNKFSLSHYKLLTQDMGELIPLTWYEALPGDSIQQSTSALIRVSPLLSPVMHPVRVRIHHWFVPNRLIWDDWEDFITGGPDGTSVPTHPYKNLTAVTEGSLRDYLGAPVDASYSPSLAVNVLPFRAYALIWNEFYRDQDLETELTVTTTSGVDSTTASTVQNVSWEKDYFTTARTSETKGDEVTIPLTGDAPVKGIGKITQTYSQSGAAYESDDTRPTYASAATIDAGAHADQSFMIEEGTTGYPNITADLSSVSGVSINDLRLALALQRYQEARSQYGSRYVEYLRYLGVRSSDARLQNPEYLGGGRQVIQFSEVLSTDGSNTGDMKGHGIAAIKTNRYRRFFEEHGIVMTLMSVIPKAIYNDSINRAFLRTTKEDYFQKELQHIGEQEITNQEVYPAHATPSGIFGYQNRYDEYRHIPSGIAGEFGSSLDHWHYARIWASDPALNASFVSAVPTKRVNASSGTDCLYVMANHSIQARRMLSARAKGLTF